MRTEPENPPDPIRTFSVRHVLSYFMPNVHFETSYPSPPIAMLPCVSTGLVPGSSSDERPVGDSMNIHSGRDKVRMMERRPVGG
ncbi:hypothetical protein EYF80_054027 [Liparis tanakae]|uniref:Uncharacterized protein n=1 Tax=Liparis tanakae TaxID=230148 RepID=A0A4Z2F5N6_9TELE|nr:hypothetical protein EYF80_054027 [Liparis tanakae]